MIKINRKIINSIPLTESFTGNIVIITHKNPDGDAIGSELALFRLLRIMNLSVQAIIPNDFPAFLAWMKDSEKIIIYEKKTEEAKKAILEAQLIFCVDFNALNRIDKVAEYVKQSTAFKVLVDHHPDAEDFCDVTISETSASSTAELIYMLIKAKSLTKYIDSHVAEAIYTGIMTDTGCFSYNSSNPDTFTIVGELLQFGIRKDAIYSNIYDNYSEDRMRLLGHSLLNNMKVFPELKTAYIALTKEELEKFKFEFGDTEGFVNYPFSVKDIKFTALFTEKKDFVRISFRSKGNFSCNDFARAHFQGGGHVNAAGGESPFPIAEVTKKFETLIESYRDELNQPLSL